MVADRSVKGQSIMGRSYCDWCRAKLTAIDLVPIASFVALGAKCRRCKKPISWQYPLVELTTGILFVTTIIFLVTGGNLRIIPILYYLFIVSVLVVVGIIDVKHFLIPTTLTLAATLVSLIYNYFNFSSAVFVDHVLAAFSAAIFFGIIVLVTLRRGMGEGDIFLAFLIGMVLGLKSTLIAIFAAFMLGAIIAILLIILGRKKFGQAVPFGPFLIMGFLVSLYWGEFLLNWYLMLY